MVEIKYLLSCHVDCDDHRGMRNRCPNIRIIKNLNKQSLWNQEKSKQEKINHKTVKTKKAPAKSQTRHPHRVQISFNRVSGSLNQPHLPPTVLTPFLYFSYYSPTTVPAFPTIKDLSFLKHA
jgi:hypothetical protein